MTGYSATYASSSSSSTHPPDTGALPPASPPPVRASLYKPRPAFAGDVSGNVKQVIDERVSSYALNTSLPIGFGPPQITTGRGTSKQSKPGKVFDRTLHATYKKEPHDDFDNQRVSEQVFADIGGKTSYKKIVPESLSLDQARFEARAFKHFANGGHLYAPNKPMRFEEVTSLASMQTKTTDWGKLAMLSHAEEGTGRLMMDLPHAGSAMRAHILSAKIELQAMQSGNNSPELSGFKASLVSSLTQLSEGGAARSRNQIDTEQRASGLPIRSTPTHQALTQQVTALHDTVYKQINARFERKWSAKNPASSSSSSSSSSPLPSATGKWWADNHARIMSADAQGKEALKAEYLNRVLDRHDIRRKEHLGQD